MRPERIAYSVPLVVGRPMRVRPVLCGDGVEMWAVFGRRAGDEATRSDVRGVDPPVLSEKCLDRTTGKNHGS